MPFSVVIPARYASSRLPGKPLLDIDGKPMIQHVYERTLLAFDHVLVATDDERIVEAVNSFNGNVVITSKDHNTGTNRCLEAYSIYTSENNLQFEIDWITGQKTGFFIDQRENRKLLQQYSTNKKVLNTFCYSGGFSIYALHAGASEVHSVDSSAKAIELTDRNVEINFKDDSKHKSFAQDTLDYLNETEEKYDTIVLDPPAYAKSKSAQHKAVQGYKRLNAKALRMINQGGVLFTFSCSQVIDRKLFENTIMAAAIEARRTIKVLHHLSQPADHPVSIFHPEGEYLKGLVLYVEE